MGMLADKIIKPVSISFKLQYEIPDPKSRERSVSIRWCEIKNRLQEFPEDA